MNDPKSWQEAVDFDKRIRIGRKKDKEESPTQQFVHASRKPLDEVDFRNLEDFGQLNMFNGECEGMCGV